MSNAQEDSERSMQGGFARGGLLRPGVLDELSAQVTASGCYIDPRAARMMGKPEDWIPIEYVDEAVASRMRCGRAEIHGVHFWQYSATGWVTCVGVDEATPIYDALAAEYDHRK